MIFRVNARVMNKGEMKEVFFIAETEHASMEALFEDFRRDGMLRLTRYDTRGPGEREARLTGGRRIRFVTDEYEAIISRDGFTSISDPIEDVIWEDGTPLYLLDEDDAPAIPPGAAA